jgi:uncharacterized protein with FMN-binding domain
MLKHRILAVVGFSVGTALVLTSSPLTLFTAPETFKRPIEPTPQATTESKPSPTPKVTVSAQETVAPSPIATTPKSTATTTAQISVTIDGNIVAADKYGDVQVQIVIKEGVITSAKALIYPDEDSRSSSISASAIPSLIEQTLEARDNSDIQGVSQASYTSEAWRISLQSALDKQK